MPSPRRKTKVPMNPKQDSKTDVPVVVQQIAKTLNLEVVALLDWKMHPDGRVVLIAPNGMKFVVENTEKVQEMMDPTTEPSLVEVTHEC